MTHPRPPDATVRITARAPNLYTLHLSGRRVRPARPIPIIDPAHIFDVLRRSIKSEWSAVQMMSDPKIVSRKFRELASSGNATLLDLIDTVPSRRRALVDEIYKFFAQVDLKSSSNTVPLLAVISDRPLPLDWLPLFRHGEYKVPEDATLEQVRRAAIATFPGLRAAIRHFGISPGQGSGGTVPESLVLDSVVLDGRRCVRVAPYWHLNLKGVREELADLGGIEPYHFDRPLPDDAMAARDEAGRELARLIADGNPDYRPQIVYITAHGRTGTDSGHEDALLFGRRSFMRDLEVEVLQRNLREWPGPLGIPEAPGPLSIVSACAAANISYANPTTIPDALQEKGHRAVVAPLLAVDTDAARFFSYAILAALAQNMSNSGQKHELAFALLEARRAWPQRNNQVFKANLGALMFACFGESRLQLDPAL